jgi:hypothetical protein
MSELLQANLTPAAFFTCFATLMIFSFLYRDNPFYKFAEHVFVGVSAGYGIVLVWFQILRPNLIDRLLPPVDAIKNELFRQGAIAPESYAEHAVGTLERLARGEWIYYIFLALGVMMLLKVSRKLHWVSRWPLAYVIGAFAGIQIIQATQGSLIPQVHATMKDFAGQGTVLELLERSGRLPEGEWEAREAAQRAWLEGWLQPLAGPEAGVGAAAAWQADLSRRQRELADPALLEEAPRRAFKQIRSRQYRIVQDDAAAEAFLCGILGGDPLETSLLAAALGGGEEARAQARRLAAEGLAGAELAEHFGPASLAALELAPWQDGLYALMTRVWLESRANRAAIEALPWSGAGVAQGVEILVHPPGRPSLTELFKREALPAGARLDWSLPQTLRLADSLLAEVNPRPPRLAEWTGAQLGDLEERLGPAAGRLSLRGELELRLQSLAQWPAADAQVFLDHWLTTLLHEARDWRQVMLLTACNRLSGPELMMPFSRGQQAAFRADPAGTMALAEEPLSAGQVRLRMLVEILSNLLVVIGVCAGVFYFFFSKKHVGALGVVSKVGIAFLMMSFGASFGYTVMGRISLAIGRFQDLLHYPLMAGMALLVLIAALALEGRRRARGA